MKKIPNYVQVQSIKFLGGFLSFFCVFQLFALNLTVDAAPEELAFDELRGQNANLEDAVLPFYRDFYAHYKTMSAAKKKALLKQFREAFEGDNSMLYMPRILKADQYDILKKGVEQRAQALKAFLADHYRQDGLEPEYIREKLIPKNVMRSILERNGEWPWFERKLIHPDTIAFWYGPDIILDPKGQFRVIEDNPGFVGGMGDLLRAREAMQKMLKADSSLAQKMELNTQNPQTFYDQLAQHYVNQAQKFAAEAGKSEQNPFIVLLQYPHSQQMDNEDKRLREIFSKAFGRVTPEDHFQIISVFAEMPLDQRLKGEFQVVYKEKNGVKTQEIEGVYLISKDKIRRVDYIVDSFEAYQLDLSAAGNWQKLLLDEAKNYLENGKNEKMKKTLSQIYSADSIDWNALRAKLLELEKNERLYPKIDLQNPKNGAIEALFEAVAAKKVGLSYTPGLDFIGDKEFYIYVEALIQHYLGETPILKNIEGGSFAASESKETGKIIKNVFKNLSHYVIKRVDGRGGDAVWIGPKLNPKKDKKQLQDLKNAIAKEPQKFIYQKYTALSELNLSPQERYIVDYRILSHVDSQKTIVTNVPWGRGISKKGSGKVNISIEGLEILNLVLNAEAENIIAENLAHHMAAQCP